MFKYFFWSKCFLFLFCPTYLFSLFLLRCHLRYKWYFASIQTLIFSKKCCKVDDDVLYVVIWCMLSKIKENKTLNNCTKINLNYYFLWKQNILHPSLCYMCVTLLCPWLRCIELYICLYQSPLFAILISDLSLIGIPMRVCAIEFVLVCIIREVYGAT